MFLLQVAQPIADWGLVVATAINAVGVLLAVQAIKHFVPTLKKRYPWLIPLIAVAAAPGLAQLTELAFRFLGHPVDFGPILAALTGTMAVTMNQVSKQTQGIKKG